MKKVNKTTKKYLAKLAKKELNKKDKEWKLAIRARDIFCIVCACNGLLHTHHIIPREIKETRHNIDNGILLCPKHHKFSRQLSAHKSPFIFYQYLWKIRPKQLYRLLKDCPLQILISDVCKVDM